MRKEICGSNLTSNSLSYSRCLHISEASGNKVDIKYVFKTLTVHQWTSSLLPQQPLTAGTWTCTLQACVLLWNGVVFELFSFSSLQSWRVLCCQLQTLVTPRKVKDVPLYPFYYVFYESLFISTYFKCVQPPPLFYWPLQKKVLYLECRMENKWTFVDKWKYCYC